MFTHTFWWDIWLSEWLNQHRTLFGSASFSAFCGGDYQPSSSQTPAQQLNEITNIGDVTPPGSMMISLHQTIGMLLSSNEEQGKAIEEPKKENTTLREQMMSVCNNIKMRKKTSASFLCSTTHKSEAPSGCIH